MRIKILRITIVSIMAFWALNLFFMQIIQGRFYYNLSVNNRIRVIPLEGMRGRIKDRNGLVLATNRLAFDVTVIPQDMKNSDELFDYLSKTLKTSKIALLKQYAKRKVTPFAPVIVTEDVDKRLAMALEENKFRFSGLYIQETFRRQYPYGEVGAHVLGYVGKISEERMEEMEEYGYTPQSLIGYSGVEQFYDRYLRGQEGGLQIEVNSRGQQVSLLGMRQLAKGKDISLTIDQRIQSMSAQVLAGKKGTIIVMDMDSGELLGLVSSPAFDPNAFTDQQQRFQARTYFVDQNAPLLNRAIKGLYPPGSVFKVAVATAGLMSEKLTPGTSFFCPGFMTLGRRSFRCSHVHGTQNLTEGIAHSCNVYFFNAGDKMGPDIIHKYARLYGLGAPTQIDLPFEEKGFVPSRVERRMKGTQGWFRGDTFNFSIGQGDTLVTPIQLVRMMATVARRGREVQPHLLKSIGDQPLVKISSGRTVPVNDKVFDTLQIALRQAVAAVGGTASVLNMEGFKVSGKTGTAQSTPGRDHHAWFVGYDTSGKTRIIFCVFLEYGGSSYNATLVARELLQGMRGQGII